jgi:hypothetical protein
MSTPCDKEEVLSILRVKQAEIAGDIQYIKKRIDNGMGHALERIDENLAGLKPVIEHHSSIVKRIEDIGWALTTSFILCVLAVVGWAIKNGFHPKI